MVSVYPSNAEDIYKNRELLRVNYDLDSNILISPNEYQKVHYSRCTVIDMTNMVFISDENAREQLCYEDDYLSYVFPNIGLPITWENLFLYAKNNKFTNVIEYELDNYISILLSINPNYNNIDNIISILKNNGYLRQAGKIFNFTYKAKYIKEKAYLYNDKGDKTGAY